MMHRMEQARGSSPGWAVGDEWESRRALIQDLYQVQNLPLKEVIRIMEERHGFRATQRMYKTRIKTWGLDKNFKHSEVVELFRLRRKRELDGKSSTVYFIRGREVDWDRVLSYVKRKGLDIAPLLDLPPGDSSSSSSSSSSQQHIRHASSQYGISDLDVTCRTPVPGDETNDYDGWSPVSSAATNQEARSPMELDFVSASVYASSSAASSQPATAYSSRTSSYDSYYRRAPAAVPVPMATNSREGTPSLAAAAASARTRPSPPPAATTTLPPIITSSPLLYASAVLPVAPSLGGSSAFGSALAPSSTASSAHPLLPLPPPPHHAATALVGGALLRDQPPESALRTFQAILSRAWETIMVEDGDRLWGTTEYWLRNARSQEWTMTMRYKLALYREFMHEAEQADRTVMANQLRRFRVLNRCFALLEPVCRGILGARTFYVINFVYAFWAAPGAVGGAVGSGSAPPSRSSSISSGSSSGISGRSGGGGGGFGGLGSSGISPNNPFSMLAGQLVESLRACFCSPAPMSSTVGPSRPGSVSCGGGGSAAGGSSSRSLLDGSFEVCGSSRDPRFPGTATSSNSNSSGAGGDKGFANLNPNIASATGYREASQQFLSGILDQLLRSMGLTLPKEVVLLLRETDDGRPIIPEGHTPPDIGNRKAPLFSSSSTTLSANDVLFDGGGAGLPQFHQRPQQQQQQQQQRRQPLPGTAAAALELAIHMLARGEDDKAEEGLLALTRFEVNRSQCSREARALFRIANYHLAKLYLRVGEGARAHEHMVRSVEKSILFDSWLAWDEANFVFA